MKRLFTFILSVSIIAVATQAQGIYQFADPGFEGTWSSDSEPGNGWTSFASADASALPLIGSLAVSQSPKPSKVGGYNSNTAVKIFSKNIIGQNANGNLTTGQIRMGSSTPTSSANYNITRTDNAKHCLLFAGTPDAVGFYAKFKSGGSPNGRGHFILHDEYNYRDPEIATDEAHRVGKAVALVAPCDDWTYCEGIFTYDRNEKPSKQYLLATFTTNPTAGGSSGDELIIDDIHFIYYSTLSALSYEGGNINFDEAVTEYDLSTVAYEAGKLSYTLKGAGATAETAYDEATRRLTITVRGNDYAVNASNMTVYSLQFGEDEGNEGGDDTVTPVLGDEIMSLDEVSTAKTYVIYNEHFTAYAIYNAAQSSSNVWAAGMRGDSGHPLANQAFTTPVDITDASSSWMVIPFEGKYYIYNVGARMYLTTPGYAGETGPCTLTATATALTIVDLGNGLFAFTATGDDKDYMCAAPQMSSPVSIWESSDAGSAWQLIENPNVAADPEIANNYTGIDAVDSVEGEQVIYDLTGRRIAEITVPGIYIINGKKVLVK